MRQAKIYYKDILAGGIAEDDDGYIFQYDSKYLGTTDPKPVSLTLPISTEPYRSKVLFPFFDGLIPEGWLLDIAIANWKINPRDRFCLLMTLCKECIGCVSVIAEDNE